MFQFVSVIFSYFKYRIIVNKFIFSMVKNMVSSPINFKYSLIPLIITLVTEVALSIVLYLFSIFILIFN